MGCSLLATQTTVFSGSGRSLYHMPKKYLLELPGENKPISNTPPFDFMVP